ncbi:hypothetical protein KSS87_001443 [Heliosperma pusillum]|nr:hypothetical protein KSS87_001443 [Heliosperma pusillum]
MGALQPEAGDDVENGKEKGGDEEDMEKGGKKVGGETINPHTNFHASMLRTLNPTNPLRVVINGGSRPPLRTPVPPHLHHPPPPLSQPRPHPPPSSHPRPPSPSSQSRFIPTTTPTPQKAVRVWPKFMVHFILWSSFGMSLSAGILLICFQKPSTDACGVALIAYAIGNGLYSCWVTQRTSFCIKILIKSLEPVLKFPDLNHPSYYMLVAGFLWMSLWILAVIGALNFYLPPLVIMGLVLSLAWTTEVMRNVANLTVSRVIALYYLRGMQSSTYFCFHRALTKNLGSAALGSIFVPTIEALRILARGLNLVEGEDEFMFSCAHCCLSCMNSIFRFGNGWAYIAAYGKSFVKASQDTWELFEKQEMESIVDADIMSAVCFLSGVCSGSICVIMVAPWTHTVHKGYTATISLLAFFVGYLMTRISMALPHACVSCFYVCYAENPENRLFDQTIPDRLQLLKSGRDVAVPTPRVPRRFNQ